MASKAVLLLLACFLLITTKVYSSQEEEQRILTQGGSDYKKPTPPPPPPSPSPPPPLVTAPPPPPPPPPPPRNIKECIPLCEVRCKNHSRKNICMRACLTCCDRCKCVPPGQYGNREKCGKCYAEMTTRGGYLKCP